MEHLEPFKFPGCKHRLLPTILALIGKVDGTYYEPYLGSGAVFYALAAAGQIEDAHLSDSDPWICRAHNECGSAESLRQVKRWGEQVFDEGWFKELRAAVNGEFHCDGWAGQFCALQGAAFQGMYRRSAKSGTYNVPWCKKPNPPIPSPERLQRAAALREKHAWEVHRMNALVAIGDAVRGDVVYLDPPYVGAWSAYGSGIAFTEHDLTMLVRACERAARRGARILLHHLDTPMFRGPVAGWEIHPVNTPARLAPKAKDRGTRNEIIAILGGAA